MPPRCGHQVCCANELPLTPDAIQVLPGRQVIDNRPKGDELVEAEGHGRVL